MNLSNLLRTITMRAISVGLTLSLLVSSTPAAPETVVGLGKESSRAFLFWFHNSGMSKLIQGRGAGNVRRQEKQRDRDAKIARIKIFPEAATVDLGEHVRFSAVAYDQKDDAVGGIKVKWSGQESAAGRRAKVSQQGEFEALAPGSFTITAETNGQSAQATVVVRPGVRRNMNEAPQRTKSVSSRDMPTNTKKISSTGNPAIPIAGNRVVARKGRVTKRSHVKNVTATPPTPILPDEGWGDDNYGSADDPGNRIGNPPGTPLDDGAGSGNFQFSAPVLSLDGRGIDLRLALTYNSRLWSKSGNQINYDNDRGWPAPGFSLGFGKMLGMGVNGGGMLIDADGTRHAYAGNITFYSWGTYGVMHTADGSFIDYTYSTGTGGGLTYAFARLANGTMISFGAPGPGAIYPTSIEDANGNSITITYVNNSGPRIQTVTDTLNRTISFHYDTNNLLTAITAPGYISGTRTLVRLHYHQLSLDTTNAFSGLTPSVREASPWVVDAIYYPGTSTGYWLNDSDSYSSYGMLAKVVEQRGMGFSASGLTDMGSVSQGSVNRSETYNYPLTPNSSLTDAPTYTSMTNTWTRDGTNFDSATTGYEVHENSTPRTVTITLPNETTSRQYSYNHPGSYDDGLVYQDETRDSNNNLLQSSSSNWAEGAYNSPRPTRVEKTDERGQVTAAEFSYGNVYNQVIEVRDYNYGGTTLLRATRTEYQNSSNYTGTAASYGYVGRHIFNLPLNVEVYDSDNTTRLSRTEYQYDGQTLSDTPNVVMHDDTHNPYAPEYEVCDCNQWDEWQINCLQWNCYWRSDYNPATNYRGNVKQVTSYADAASPAGAVTETRRYDITGNLVTASTSCCEQTSFNYTSDTQYAYPLSKTRGSATDAYAQVTTSATYDFNTGLGLSVTDANGRQSQISYDSATLRPTTSTSPTGAHTDFAYDDAAMTLSSTTYLSSGEGGGIADQSMKYLNGIGQVRQEKARGVNNTWDFVDTIYNNLGQVYQQSRLYRSGDTQQWSTATYDALGRTRTVTAPDGSVTQTFYDETSRPDVASSTAGETTRVQDAWGRERWGRTDASGRLVEVVEPNPGGNGSVATSGLVTTYTYNTLGNLITVSQGAQTRSFAYDSLGRLTAQKLAEQSATLNDAGTHVGSGTWSDVFTYDSRSNLSSRTDARGVKTVYSYGSDPLNRLQSVSWDTSGFGDTGNPIVSTATVSYSYRAKSSGAQLLDVTQLSSVTAAGVSTESYGFDAEGRVSTKTLTLSSRSSYPFVTDYSYDSLDRATDVWYPAEYGNGSPPPRKVVHHDYDIASRLSSLTYDGQSFASSIVYNAASQTTSLNVGSGTNQIAESYSYGAQTGLLDNQTVARGATTLLNLSYDYANSNGKRTGQLTKLLNNLDHNKDRGYSYDALGRLVQATGGPSSATLSTQTYSYDRYGNRTSVTASGYSAKNGSAGAGSAGVPPALSARNQQGSSPTVREGSGTEPGAVATGSITQPSDTKVALPTDLLAKNNSVDSPASARGDGQPVSDSPPTLRAPLAPPSDPPTFTDPNLLITGGVEIKALHITELRTAINNLRVRLGMSAYTWTKPTATGGVVATGGLISAEPIVEMRTALDQALGAPSPAYAAGLALGQPILAIHIQELRNRVVAGWAASSQIPRDGHGSLSYDTATNRITTSGFAYDAAGNQVRAIGPSGSSSQRFKYDAANRLVQVLADNNTTVLAAYTYGDSNERLVSDEAGYRTYYVGEGGTIVAEYTESGNSTAPQWSKGYVYLGARLLSTLAPNGSGGEAVQYHHPDRLGTRLVTDPSNGTSFEQVTLPFGTPLNAESTGATNRRFTSYDRSPTTGLDYAVNRHYDPQQGRFTQVDPIGIKASSLEHPQTLNLYSYVGNDPVNQIDPSGLFWGKIGRFFKKVGKFLEAVGNAVSKVLNNRWVRIGIFIAGFLVPFLGPVLSTIIKVVVKAYNIISDIASQLQSYGQLLQGKFKELALNIAAGIAGAYIGMVEDAVVASIQLSIKLDGLSFSSVLDGAVWGFKQGFSRLSANLFGRTLKDMFIPAYGLFGGPSNPANTEEGKDMVDDPVVYGVDDTDHQYKGHDQEYRNPNKTPRSVRDADVRLVKGLLRSAPKVHLIDIAFGRRPSSGSVYKFLGMNFFSGAAAVRTARL